MNVYYSMDFTYSPSHSGGGGTLHLSPSHAHPHDPTIARNLRRSLSRSPSKPRFQHSNSPNRALRFSATAPNTPSASNHRHHIIVDDFHLPSAKKPRPTLRRTSPLSSASPAATPATRPLRRALSDNSDSGNANSSPAATPPKLCTTTPDDQENCLPSLHQDSSSSSEESLQKSPLAGLGSSHKAPPSAASRLPPVFRPVNRGWRPVKSSPLKRSDAVMNLTNNPPASPSAKRRTICGGIVSSPFGPVPRDWDHAMADGDTEDSDDDDSSQDVPIRSSLFPRPLNLRRSKPSAKSLERTSQPPARRSLESARDSPRPSRASSRNRLQLPSALFNTSQPLDSHFADFSDPARTQSVRTGRAQPHPLSKALSPTSPSVAGTAISSEKPLFQTSPVKSLDFSKSLPIGALRPGEELHRQQTVASQNSSAASPFATPKFYHIAKPDPAAFRSTGLISKKHRNPDDIPPPPSAHPGMPDTPCKRVQGAFTFSASPTPTNSVVKEQRFSQPLFGTPSKLPDSSNNSHTVPARHNSDLFGHQLEYPNITQHGNAITPDGDENLTLSQIQTESQSSADELPPTPTKQIVGPLNGNKQNSLRSTLLGRKPSISPNTFVAPAATETEKMLDLDTSFFAPPPPPPLPGSFSNGSVPHTPIDHSVPDPSGLSISPNLRKMTSPINTMGSFAKPGSITPATPTHRDGLSGFNFNRPLMTPSNHGFAQDLDPVLSRRFKKVEWYGRGHFSEVYKVCEPQEPGVVQSYFNSFGGSSVPQTPIPDQVFIVKKSKMPYTSMKIRQRKLREAAIMAALGKNDHTVHLLNSWEAAGHMYIQTEFCEEGSLEQFLDKIGTKGRLDDFRIWKILIELSEGVKHIHDSGFIHLDLKPANVFVDFAGVLKIGDFGLATEWPAPESVEGEGDRRYMGPDLLQGAFDKPADIFALGMMMFEIAGNCELPDNGTYWHHLRSGNWSDLPSLTSVSSYNTSLDSQNSMFGGASPQAFVDVKSHESLYHPHSPEPNQWQDNFCTVSHPKESAIDMAEPPQFMRDPDHPEALEQIVHWMMQPEAGNRPVVDQILAAGGCRWVDERRRAGAVVFEGAWGPPTHLLASNDEQYEDEEMMDVP